MAIAELDVNDEEKVLEQFTLAKRTDQNRRMRNIDLQKKNIQTTLNDELNMEYNSFEDMVRRKNNEKELLDTEVNNLKKRIEERKERLAKTSQMQGLSKEEQEKLLKNYFEQLELLDTAYSAEQRRQHL